MSLIRPTERNVDCRVVDNISISNVEPAARSWPIIALHFGIDDADILRAARGVEPSFLVSKAAQ